MPELPEVENVRRSLIRANLPGRAITCAAIGWPNCVKRPSPEALTAAVAGRAIASINRRAKYLLFPLTGHPPATLIAHLGMTGDLAVHPAQRPPPPLTRHTFHLDDGRELRFIDGRKFGKLWLTADPSEVLPTLSPEPLSDDFTVEWLATALARRNAPVKAMLLEQSVAAGLGNLYADEALYLSGIRPTRPASQLTADEITRLRQGIIDSIAAGFAVYDRARDQSWPEPPSQTTTWSHPRNAKTPCPQCRGPMTATKIRARATWYCAQCQQ